MSWLTFMGALLLISGVCALKKYIQQKGWPVIEGELESVIEPTGPTDLVGLFSNQNIFFASGLFIS